MKNNLQIFSSDNLEPIRDFEKSIGDYLGVIYFFEYGNKVKIGRTIRPYQRIKALKRDAERYHETKTGRVAFTQLHTNFVETEKIFHKYFDDMRVVNTELFDISFDCLLQELANIDVDYKDESEQKKACIDEIVDGAINYFHGGCDSMRHGYVNKGNGFGVFYK